MEYIEYIPTLGSFMGSILVNIPAPWFAYGIISDDFDRTVPDSSMTNSVRVVVCELSCANCRVRVVVSQLPSAKPKSLPVGPRSSLIRMINGLT